MAFSAVVLPAPLGPMSPTMRPSSMRKSIPSSATVDPKVLRRPRASMHAIALALLLLVVERWPAVRLGIQQFFGVEAQPLNSRLNPRPFVLEKLLAFALQKQTARADIDEHPQSAPLLYQLLVDELLVSLQHSEW